MHIEGGAVLARALAGKAGMAIVWVAAGACAPQASDYTPQIHVAPGAAARMLWIQSKNAPKGDEELESDASAEPQEEGREAPSAEVSPEAGAAP
jgi:hypothetical protein